MFLADIEWNSIKMGRTSMGCCYEDEKVYTKVARYVEEGKYIHVEKLKNRGHFGNRRSFERMDKAIWKMNNNDWD